MCATECSARWYARRDGRAMWVACNRARFPATRPRVFCELEMMKIVILIYQLIQKKFAYGELFMLVMIGYIFMFKIVKEMQNSGFEIVAGLTRPLKTIAVNKVTNRWRNHNNKTTKISELNKTIELYEL